MTDLSESELNHKALCLIFVTNAISIAPDETPHAFQIELYCLLKILSLTNGFKNEKNTLDALNNQSDSSK